MQSSTPINRYTAKFLDRDLERSFEQYWSTQFVDKDRFMLYTAIVVYSLYALLDIFTLDEPRNIVLFLRALMVAGALATMTLTYTPLGKKHFQTIACILMTMAGLSLSGMIWLLDSISPPYYIGLIIAAMITTNLMRVTVPKSLILHSLLYGSFVFVVSGMPMSNDLIAAHIFIVNSILLSVVSNYFLEVRRREEYIQYCENQDYAGRLRDMVDEANRSIKRKNAVLNALTHVFKTPLHQIIGYSQIIEQESLGPHEVKEYGEFSANIHSAGKDLLRVVQRILTYSRLDAETQALNRQNTTTTEVIDCALSRLTETLAERKVEVLRDVAHVRLRADGTLLELAVYELVSNAIEASEENASITIAAADDDGDIVISVADQGPGIDLSRISEIQNTLERMEDFLDVGAKISLGVTLATKIAQTHGGRLKYLHGANGGTIARLVLDGEENTPSAQRDAPAEIGEKVVLKAVS